MEDKNKKSETDDSENPFESLLSSINVGLQNTQETVQNHDKKLSELSEQISGLENTNKSDDPESQPEPKARKKRSLLSHMLGWGIRVLDGEED